MLQLHVQVPAVPLPGECHIWVGAELRHQFGHDVVHGLLPPFAPVVVLRAQSGGPRSGEASAVSYPTTLK